MKIRFKIFFIIYIVICLSIIYGKDRWRTNIYQSSVSGVVLDLTADSEEGNNQNVQNVLMGKEKWCDEFIKQNPGKLKGVITFKGKKRVVGIGYDSSAVKARKKANKNSLTALEGSDLNEMGMYATMLKVRTTNGYFVFAILRSPVSKGFKFEDFKDQSDDVIKTITDE